MELGYQGTLIEAFPLKNPDGQGVLLFLPEGTEIHEIQSINTSHFSAQVFITVYTQTPILGREIYWEDKISGIRHIPKHALDKPIYCPALLRLYDGGEI